jgi:TonB family protein
MIRLTMCFLAISLCYSGLGQNPVSGGALQTGYSIAKLPLPSYPPIARAAHVSGDVVLKIALRGDGTIDSVEALSGPPMLRQPAIDIAKQTQFQCGGCNGSTTSFRVTYRFEFGPALYCPETRDSSYPRVTQSMDTVTIADQPFGTCDPASVIERVRARSAKCLFLWKCGWR